jgi:hypothetical protein
MTQLDRDHIKLPCEFYGTSDCKKCEICVVDGSKLVHLDDPLNEAFIHSWPWKDREEVDDDIIYHPHLSPHHHNQPLLFQKIA